MKKVKTAAGTLSALLLGACVNGEAPAADAAGVRGARVEISATLKCPIPMAKDVSKDVATAAMYLAAPGIESMKDCDPGELGPICTALIMTRITCTWENMNLGGQELTESLWHGQGYSEGEIAVAEEGYDSGLLASGDRYLSRWSEFMLPGKTIAVWRLVFGTGSLAGIAGQAIVECPPSGGASVETCTVKGWYSLPKVD
jgi:hypothetical protein